MSLPSEARGRIDAIMERSGLVGEDTRELRADLEAHVEDGGGRDVALTVLRKGFRLAAVGTAFGVVISLLAAPALAPFLGDVSPADPATCFWSCCASGSSHSLPVGCRQDVP